MYLEWQLLTPINVSRFDEGFLRSSRNVHVGFMSSSCQIHAQFTQSSPSPRPSCSRVHAYPIKSGRVWQYSHASKRSSCYYPSSMLRRFLVHPCHLPYNLKVFKRDGATWFPSLHQTSSRNVCHLIQASWSVQASVTQAHTGRYFPLLNTHPDILFHRLNRQSIGFCGSECHAAERHPCAPW